MKYRMAFFGPRIVVSLAAAASIGIAMTATSAQAGRGSAAPRPACSLNPSPPSGFREHKVQVGGIGINYVRGGHGPTLLLLHGYPQTWYSWNGILPALARHYTVIAPDLPGAGLSDAPAGATGYTKKAMAADIYRLMVKLGLSHRIRIVGHDIGTMVAYAYAAAHPSDVVKLVLSEAPIPDPSIYTFPALTARGPGLWWFGLFAKPNGLAEHLLAGKEKLFVADFIPTLEVVKSVTSCGMAVYAHFLAQPGLRPLYLRGAPSRAE